MSQVELSRAPAPVADGTHDIADRQPRRRGRPRFFASELLMIFRRRRNIALLFVLAAVPVLIAVSVKLSGHHDRGDSIFGGITDNGLFAALAALLVVMPLFLPLGVAVVAGDAIAGEANTGTLRYLLAVPVGRGRLLAPWSQPAARSSARSCSRRAS
jgi:ABC-2 type transport system permease protein